MESNHLLMLFRHPREPSTPEFQNFAGQEGFEPSTIRLTAERTTAVLLTQKRQSPDVSARALFILHAAT